MARLGAKVSLCEVSSILKNTCSVGIFWWKRPHTTFLGLIGYMVQFGGKVVPVENFAQFCLKSPLEIVFPKNMFSVWIFVLNRTSPIVLVKRTTWHDWGQKCLGVKLRPSQKTRFWLEFFAETSPYLISWPNWLYGAFGGKIVPD